MLRARKNLESGANLQILHLIDFHASLLKMDCFLPPCERTLRLQCLRDMFQQHLGALVLLLTLHLRKLFMPRWYCSSMIREICGIHLEI